MTQEGTLTALRDDHDETRYRLEALERDKNKVIGMAAGAGGVAGIIAKWLMAKL